MLRFLRARLSVNIQDSVSVRLFNRLEAAVIEDTVAKGYTASNADLVFNTIPSNPQEAGSAIAFPKGSEQVAGFNKVIRQMKENGELEKLAKKWFEK